MKSSYFIILFCFLILAINDNVFGMKHFNLIDQEQQYGNRYKRQRCDDYDINRPFCVKSKVPSFYIANFICVNDFFDQKQLYIYPSNNNDVLFKCFLLSLLKWSSQDSCKAVNVWYDGDLIQYKAVERTRNYLDYNYVRFATKKIHFRDIRTIPKVLNNPKVFSHYIPVHFRSDLLRAVIALEMFRLKETEYFIYADLGLEPLSNEEIFDPDTMLALEIYGLVFACGDKLSGRFDNVFQIICGHNPILLETINLAIIDLNIIRANNALNGQFYKSDGRKSKKGPMKPLQSAVRQSYEPMIALFCSLMKLGTFKLIKENREYLLNLDWLRPFGLDRVELENFTFDSKYKWITGLSDDLQQEHLEIGSITQFKIRGYVDRSFLTSFYDDGPTDWQRKEAELKI